VPAELARDRLHVIVCATYGDGEVPTSARAFHRAVQDGGLSLAGVRYAMFGLGYAEGRFAEAADAVREALELDPLSSSGQAGLAVMCRSAGDIAEARTAARRAMELDPESLYAHWAMLYALSGGDAVEEVRALTQAAMTNLGRHPWLYMAEAINLPKGADRTRAEARYAELAARARTEYVQPSVLAALAACVGRVEESAEWLARAVEIRDSLVLALVAQFQDLQPVLHRPEVRALLERSDWLVPNAR